MREMARPAPQNSATIVNMSVSVSVLVALMREMAWTSAVMATSKILPRLRRLDCRMASFRAIFVLGGKRFQARENGFRTVSFDVGRNCRRRSGLDRRAVPWGRQGVILLTRRLFLKPSVAHASRLADTRLRVSTGSSKDRGIAQPGSAAVLGTAG